MITTVQFKTLDDLYKYYNGALFGGTLSDCIVNMSRHNHTYGFFAADRWKTGEEGDVKRAHEISLNPDYLDRPFAEWHATLVHEMVHLWQQDYGHPSRAAYHNKEWGWKMEEIGLVPSDTGEPGGKKTGQKVHHYVKDNGPFINAFNLLSGGDLLALRLKYLPAFPQGKIMLDFQWNEIMRGKGYGEMALPMWDKRMWDDDGSWLQAPTLRTVTEIAVTVASGIVSTGAGSLLMASVQTAGIGLAKDVFFSSIDFAGGYIDSSQFGTQLGTSILSAGVNVAVGAAFNGVGNIDKATGIAELGGLKAVVGKEAMGNMFVKAGMSMAQTYTAGVASSFVAAIVSDDYWGTVGEAAWSTGTLANVVSAGAGSLAGDALNKLNEVTVNTHAGFSFENKINAGDFANFAGSLAGAGAGYAIGGEMTLNVLNLKDLSGGELGSTGLLELRLGKDGTAMNLGTGGVDVSLGTVGNALAGAAVLGTNGLVSLYEAVTGRKDIGETLRSQYGYGGIEEKLQLFGIVTGLTGLELAEKGEFTAETTRDGFRKTVTLNGYRKGMSVEEQLQMGVLLSQEAYRDGVVTEDNYLETRGAVLGHTEMAARMRDAGYDFSGNAVIAADLAAYDYARSVGDMSLMDLYADLAYRSDGDYFDLKKFFKRVIEGLIEDNLNGDTPSRGTASAFGVLSTYTGFAGDIADEAGAAKLLGRTSIVTGLASLIMKGIEAAHNPTVDNIKGLPGDAASVVFGAIGGTAFGILGGVSISFYVDAGLFLTKNVAKLEYMLKHHPMEAMQGIYNYSVNYSGRNGEK